MPLTFLEIKAYKYEKYKAMFAKNILKSYLRLNNSLQIQKSGNRCLVL
jgi:hypothetical protein